MASSSGEKNLKDWGGNGEDTKALHTYHILGQGLLKGGEGRETITWVGV